MNNNDDYQEIDEEDTSETKTLDPSLQSKNYITPGGLEALKIEYKNLKYAERPEICKTVQWAAENGDRSENADYQYGKRRLRQIDKRLGFLGKKIRNAEVVDPSKIKSDVVSFGATVTIQYEDDSTKTYSIVGVDEMDVSKGRISWVSPVASALINHKEGDFVQFRSPKGIQEIQILKIQYLPLSN